VLDKSSSRGPNTQARSRRKQRCETASYRFAQKLPFSQIRGWTGTDFGQAAKAAGGSSAGPAFAVRARRRSAFGPGPWSSVSALACGWLLAMQLAYRNALVTGASSGLGRSLATWLARRGVQVYAAARRTEALEVLKGEVGSRILPVTLDVSDAELTRSRIGELDEASGGLDLVVANAGVGGETSGRRLDWNRVSRIIDVNVTGAVATLTAALPGMLARGRGHLVAVSSLAGRGAVPGYAAYCASKAWLSMFCECLRFDVEPKGLHVTVIHPGFVKTEMTANSKTWMPFLLEADDAADRMGRAIARRAKDFAFPWQLSLLQRLNLALPRPLYRLMASRL
jgi:NADP-dependent 3-hydroxy acid dehydrogenase YdfG